MNRMKDGFVNGANDWLRFPIWAKVTSAIGSLVLLWMIIGLFFGLLCTIMMPFKHHQGKQWHNQRAYHGADYGHQQRYRDDYRPARGDRYQARGRYYEDERSSRRGGDRNVPYNEYDNRYHDRYEERYEGRYETAPHRGYDRDDYRERGYRSEGRRAHFGPIGILFFLIGGLMKLACLAGLVGLGFFAFRRYRNSTDSQSYVTPTPTNVDEPSPKSQPEDPKPETATEDDILATDDKPTSPSKDETDKDETKA